MPLNAGSEERTGGGGAALGEGQEEKSTAHLAGGVLHGGQVEGLSLGPVVRDIVAVFGVGRDLPEQTPAGFDVGQILFALIFSAAFVQQAVSAPDAFQGAVTEGEIELADETASPESGELLAQRENLLFDGERSFARLMMRGAGEFD